MASIECDYVATAIAEASAFYQEIPCLHIWHVFVLLSKLSMHRAFSALCLCWHYLTAPLLAVVPTASTVVIWAHQAQVALYAIAFWLLILFGCGIILYLVLRVLLTLMIRAMRIVKHSLCLIGSTLVKFLTCLRQLFCWLTDPDVVITRDPISIESTLISVPTTPSEPLPPAICLGGTSLEMAIKGNTPVKQTGKVVGVLRLYNGDDLVGTASRVLLNGNDVMLTAYHVWEELDDEFVVRGATSNFGKKILKSESSLYYKGDALDQVAVRLPVEAYATLAVKQLSVAYPRASTVSVFTPVEDGILRASGILQNKGSMGLLYGASTEPGSSGSPLLQGGKVVGVHTGANHNLGLNTGYALPLFLFDSVCKESPTNMSLVRIDTNPPSHAHTVDFTFYGPDGSMEQKYMKADGDRLYHSWADEVDALEEDNRKEVPSKKSVRFNDVGLESAIPSEVQQEESGLMPDFPCPIPVPQPVSGASSGNSGLSTLTLCTQPPSTPSESSETMLREFSKLQEELSHLRSELQLLSKQPSENSPNSGSGPSQTRRQRQNSKASSSRQSAPSVRQPQAQRSSSKLRRKPSTPTPEAALKSGGTE